MSRLASAARLAGLLACCAALAHAAGCRNMESAQPAQLEQGLVWLFPGVEGGPDILSPACEAFREEGVDAAIRIHNWRRPFGIVANLARHDENRADAARIAEEIVTYHERLPGAPIDIVGYSGGGGMAIMVAEALPDRVHLRHIVLCQPAVSPDYDLKATLEKVDGTMVHYHAHFDWFILGMGTSLFGTMDRRFEASAGKDGFRLASLDGRAYLADRLLQIPWTPKMVSKGHLGGHLGILMKGWNRTYVAPYLLPCGPHGHCLACGIRH